jgi:membrane associated rhomboid family serine protease
MFSEDTPDSPAVRGAPGPGYLADVLPLHDDNPTRSRPYLTWLIIALCLVSYFAWQPSPLSDDTDDIEFNLRNAAIPCELVEGRPLDEAEVVATFNQGLTESCDIDDGRTRAFDADKNVWLAVLTSVFLHGSLLHIAGNMLFLWVFGNNIEDVLGKVAYVLFYLAGGIVATLTHVALNLESTVPTIGASGAIAAVMGAYLVLFPNARVYTAIFMILITVIPIRAKWVLGIWFVLQFLTSPNSGVAWAAHVGGFVFGVVVGLIVRAFRGTGPPAPALRPGQWPPPPQGPRPAWDDPRYR